MAQFKFEVTVEADNLDQASQVMIERINYDEDYGFDYRIWHESEPVLDGQVFAGS